MCTTKTIETLIHAYLIQFKLILFKNFIFQLKVHSKKSFTLYLCFVLVHRLFSGFVDKILALTFETGRVTADIQKTTAEFSHGRFALPDDSLVLQTSAAGDEHFRPSHLFTFETWTFIQYLIVL
jgi:hypothetical protein